jgi:hypothetical protein
MKGVFDILSYDDDETDIVLNYFALFLSFLALSYILNYLPSSYGIFRLYWIPLNAFLFAFQVSVCSHI